MWLFWGGLAVVTAVLNFVRAARDKDSRWFRHASLSFTALTLCFFYSQAAAWAAHGDWAALADVLPTMSKWLWVCTALSILINGVSLFRRSGR